MEESVENNVCLQFSDICAQLGISSNNSIDAIITTILESETTFSVDIFPAVIKNPDKYKQVEIFYQSYLDKEISSNEFKTFENKYQQFIKYIWLYNDTYVYAPISFKEFKKNYYANKNRKLFKKYTAFLRDILDLNCFTNIENYELLVALTYLSTRDITPVLFYCAALNSIIYLHGCNCKIYSNNTANVNSFKLYAEASRLFII